MRSKKNTGEAMEKIHNELGVRAHPGGAQPKKETGKVAFMNHEGACVRYEEAVGRMRGRLQLGTCCACACVREHKACASLGGLRRSAQKSGLSPHHVY